VTSPAACGGSYCPPLVNWVPCQIQPCQEVCLWSDWSGWSTCPTCGTPSLNITQFRSQKLLQGNTSICGGDSQGHQYQEQPCKMNSCPIDCEVSDWTVSACSVTCGLGVVTMTRHIQTQSANGGAHCPYLIQYQPCPAPVTPCIPDCVISDWSAWSPCSATCQVNGTAAPFQTRTRVILVQGAGPDCLSSAPLSQSQTCNAIPCPVNCLLSDWSDWSPSPCGFVGGAQRCGLNLQTRSRDVIIQPANGGRICQITFDQQYCEGPPCENPCLFTPWSEWSNPTATCGTAYHTRNRYLLNAGANGTDACPHLSETVLAPGIPLCPVNCVFEYSEWGDCSAQGYKRRNVIIVTQAAYGGKACPTCQVEKDDCTPPPSGGGECWLENC